MRFNPERISILYDILIPIVKILSTAHKDQTPPGPELKVTTSDPLWVRADSLRLKQVVMNLAKNAVKFVPRGFIHVGARLKATQTATDTPSSSACSSSSSSSAMSTIEVWVEDSGPGIPLAMQEKVFNKYEQLKSVPIQGTGIGLALCQQIVHQMSGNIKIDPDYRCQDVSEVQSCPTSSGNGARFVFQITIPRESPPTQVATAKTKNKNMVLANTQPPHPPKCGWAAPPPWRSRRPARSPSNHGIGVRHGSS